MIGVVLAASLNALNPLDRRLLSMKAQSRQANASRREEFVSGKTDHGKQMRVRSAFAEDGTVLARHTEFFVDNGAYT